MVGALAGEAVGEGRMGGGALGGGAEVVGVRRRGRSKRARGRWGSGGEFGGGERAFEGFYGDGVPLSPGFGAFPGARYG